MFQRRFWISLILTLPVLLFSPTIQGWLGFTITDFPSSQWITPIFSFLVFVYGGLPFLRMARGELKDRKPGMMTLISLAIMVAFLYSVSALIFDLGTGFFWELVTLIDVMLLGHWIEMRSVRQASSALDQLMTLMPDKAERIREDGGIEEIPVSALNPGELVLVRPGDSVPADGEIREGNSQLDESMITGESKPVSKGPGDEVIAGTINGDGSLRVQVTATGEDTALAGIYRLVEEAQESKSETQLLADRAAGWLFYTAIGVALITAAAWVIAVGFDINVIKRVATVLVIACPHALGLAVPLVVAITTSLAARNGVLVRKRSDLEQAKDLDVVIFDKTGTLTKGTFSVVNVESMQGWTPEEALALAAAVERDSEHNIARAVRSAAAEKSLSLPDVEQFENIKGFGVKAVKSGESYYVGAPRLVEQLSLSIPEELSNFEEAESQKGRTVVFLIHEKGVLAAFSLSDVIRPESKATIVALHEMGIDVAMLTGDSQDVADRVAGELGLDRYFAEVLPEDKDKKVRQLQKEGFRVAMVGDGVNDAPALARADIGIAIGQGTDVAVESAGIILVKSNPMDVLKIINLSQASHKKMIQNLFWAAGYNVIALPLAAGALYPVGVVLSPAVGALLMSLSTVIVAINAQLMRNITL
ncbi:MAG: heavy metal translocating P-type ATPase [Anaerolineales bacterium]